MVYGGGEGEGAQDVAVDSSAVRACFVCFSVPGGGFDVAVEASCSISMLVNRLGWLFACKVRPLFDLNVFAHPPT